MTATARAVVLMTPAEKAALDVKARQAGRIPTAEFVRRAVDAYDVGTEREAEELRQLDRTDQKLDTALASLADARRRR